MLVEIFWGIGRFIINNKDTITIMIDNKMMFEHLSGKEEAFDDFIKMKIRFIAQLTDKKKIKIKYEFIESKKNLATKSRKCKGT